MSARLGKLLRLALGSDRPGEAAAAIAALNRALQEAGSDYHALAAIVERSPPVPEQMPPQEAPWRKVRGFCAGHADLLSERDQQFIASLARWRGRPTERQLEWLFDIEARVLRKK
jgi:hypothetical protein